MAIARCKTRLSGIILLVAILLTGCGDTLQSDNGNTTAQKEEGPFYKLSEYKLPNPDESLEQMEVEKQDNWVWRDVRQGILNGRLYRYMELCEFGTREIDGVSYMMALSHGNCIQLLSEDGTTWENYPLSKEVEFGTAAYGVEAVVGIGSDGFELLLNNIETKRCAIGHMDWDGTSELLYELSETEEFPQGFQHCENDNLYAFSTMGNQMNIYDLNTGTVQLENLQNTVMGVVEKGVGGESIWYGRDQDGIVVWDAPNGKQIAKITQGPDRFRFYIGAAEDGSIVLANDTTVWMYTGETKQLFQFYEQDYVIDEILGISIPNTGVIQFYTCYNDEFYIVTATETDTKPGMDKQEIIFATGISDSQFHRTIAAFNRSSDKYHITVDSGEGEEWWSYFNRIQMELSAGRGPDLMTHDVFEVTGAVEQGLVAELGDVLEGDEMYIPSLQRQGQTGGKQYAIIYAGRLQGFVVSKDMAADRQSWTLDEMIQEVKESEAVILCPGYDGVDIILSFVLQDDNNKSFIDWEKGESYLSEQAFLDALEFAKMYADTEGRDAEQKQDEVSEMIQDGKVAGVAVSISGAGDINYINACFNGKGVCIGYPDVDGTGIYGMGPGIYVNKSSDNVEGAKEFLRYLLTADVQEQLSLENGFSISMPVRYDILQECVDAYNAKVTKTFRQEELEVGGRYGINYRMECLKEEDEQMLQSLVDNATSGLFKVYSIQSIVAEELEPYFQGEKSAQEAATALDSRVQLYLDERE